MESHLVLSVRGTTKRGDDGHDQNHGNHRQRSSDWHVPPVGQGHLDTHEGQDNPKTGLQILETVAHVGQKEVQGTQTQNSERI